MALKESQLRDAARRVSSDPAAFSRTGGARSTESDWESQQRRIARALVSDPDLVIYFAWLASNRACALAQSVAKQLCELAVLVEGWKYPAVAVAEPVRLKRALSTLAARDTVTEADVARLAAETDAYIRGELVPKVARNGRVQPRGEEALSSYTGLRSKVELGWRKLRRALADATSSRVFTREVVRGVALRTPLAALGATADLLDPARLTDFTVQLAAASAAVAACGRNVDLRLRLRVGEDDFPGGVVATAVVADNAVVRVELSVSPLDLGVRSGDTVRWNGGQTIVVGVDAEGIDLADGAITASGRVLDVLSTAYLAWERALDDTNDLYIAMPGETEVVAELRAREDRSAARIVALVEYLVKLAAQLDGVTDAAEAAAGRVGADVYVADSTVAGVLRDFDPLFSNRTKQAGERILKDLEGAGFDYAVDLLYRGQIDQLLQSTAAQASKFGRTAEVASTIGVYTGGARGVG